jgi:2-dehydropantoate 2-reductase
VGGYFGGLLARAGNQVILIARGSHLDAIRTKGLEVQNHWGDFTVSVEATDHPADVGPVDLALLTVKTYQNSAVVPTLAPLVGDNTCIMTLQNGVDAYQEVGRVHGLEHVLPGAAYIETQLASPGVIRQVGQVVRIVFGEVDGGSTDRAQSILATLQAANINAELATDVVKTLWTKFIFISTLAGITSTARASMAPLLADPTSKKMVVACLQEIEAVGRANKVDLDTDVVEKTMAYMESTAKDLHASMHTDLEMGRPLELEALNGAVVRIGREAGIPTPVNDILYSLLVVHKAGAPPS